MCQKKNFLILKPLKLAIFKKDDKIDKENFRPVSILPTLSKVYKRLIYDQLYPNFEKSISKSQASLRNNEDNFCLISVIKKWEKSLDPYLLIFLRDLTALIMNYCWPNFMHTVLTKILYISFIVIFKSNPSKNQNRNFLKHIRWYSIRSASRLHFWTTTFQYLHSRHFLWYRPPRLCKLCRW